MLSAAYDLIATALVNPADDEDLALTLNGKKKKRNRNDFAAAFNTLKLEARLQENIFSKMKRTKAGWMDFIDTSFISNDLKIVFKTLINKRFSRL